MKKRSLLIIIIVVVVLILAGLLYTVTSSRDVIASDTTIHGDMHIAAGKTFSLKQGATLTVTGKMTIDGTISCDGGGLALTVQGSLFVNGNVHCVLADPLPPSAESGIAISITAKQITFGEHSEVDTNGHIELTNDPMALLSTAADVAHAYDETLRDAGGNVRIGPFVRNTPTQTVTEDTNRDNGSAEGSTTPDIVLGGTWHIGDGVALPSDTPLPSPLKHINGILVDIDSGNNGELLFRHFRLIGGSGNRGDNDIDSHCNAIGNKGGAGMRLRIQAGHITLDDLRLELGDGGIGGDARTKSDCTLAIAAGGSGGEPGNFKITADKGIDVVLFAVVPGKGGAGGSATALGKNTEASCPTVPGGSATATGGNGAQSPGALAMTGMMAGVHHMTIGRFEGGTGGAALATAGNGGNSATCGCAGGDAGNTNATGGNGGDALVSIPIITAEGHGGDGGDADTKSGDGGAGGGCATSAHGGDGGAGGNADAHAGQSGKGTTAMGNSGKVKNTAGGRGGSGGDGCAAGKGGQGGIGAPLGMRGVDGRDLCPENAPTPSANAPQPTTIPLISAILYHSKYLPIGELIMTNEAGCGQAHWRSKNGGVTATDGTYIADPTTKCGYGTVQDYPQISVPKEVIKVLQ